MITSEFLFPYVVANVMGLALVVAAIAWPKLGRGAYVFMFAGAGIANGIIGIDRPDIYVTGFGPVALFPAYRDFIHGFFAEHAAAIVLAIAFCQLCIAVLLTRSQKPFLIGVIGGTIFLAAIAPLGVGSALPASVLYGVGLVVLYRRLRREFVDCE